MQAYVMVEVFKTNVKDQHQADLLVEQIQKVFIGYKANFDLEDCDNILRVKCTSGIIDVLQLINFFRDVGFHAEILPDEPLREAVEAGKEASSRPRFYNTNTSRN